MKAFILFFILFSANCAYSASQLACSLVHGLQLSKGSTAVEPNFFLWQGQQLPISQFLKEKKVPFRHLQKHMHQTNQVVISKLTKDDEQRSLFQLLSDGNDSLARWSMMYRGADRPQFKDPQDAESLQEKGESLFQNIYSQFRSQALTNAIKTYGSEPFQNTAYIQFFTNGAPIAQLRLVISEAEHFSPNALPLLRGIQRQEKSQELFNEFKDRIEQNSNYRNAKLAVEIGALFIDQKALEQQLGQDASVSIRKLVSDAIFYRSAVFLAGMARDLGLSPDQILVLAAAYPDVAKKVDQDRIGMKELFRFKGRFAKEFGDSVISSMKASQYIERFNQYENELSELFLLWGHDLSTPSLKDRFSELEIKQLIDQGRLVRPRSYPLPYNEQIFPWNLNLQNGQNLFKDGIENFQAPTKYRKFLQGYHQDPYSKVGKEDPK